MQTMTFRERGYGPDFIGVGPEKTGTTWIYRQLLRHPGIFVPRDKELRFFWEKHKFPDENFFQRMIPNVSWHRRKYRRVLSTRINAICKHPILQFKHKRKQILWDLNYVFRKHDDNWYLSCFPPRLDGIVRGEISPQYFFLPPAQIRGIRELLPHVKIIITLRHPVDWLWSFVRMREKLAAGGADAQKGSTESFVRNRINLNSFAGAVSNWTTQFPKDQLLILIYDDLLSDPGGYYTQICEFLGIPARDSEIAEAAQRVNAGSSTPPPDWLVELAEDGWRDDMKKLSDIIDIPSRWHF